MDGPLLGLVTVCQELQDLLKFAFIGNMCVCVRGVGGGQGGQQDVAFSNGLWPDNHYCNATYREWSSG